MRQKLVFLAVLCMIALPLAAAPSSTAQAPATVQSAPASPSACTPLSVTGMVLPIQLPLSSVLYFGEGRCATGADCTDWCLQNWGSPYGFCVDTWCKCLLP